MSRTWLAVAAVAGMIAVALGAFGAHGLRPVLPLQKMTIFETAVRYHMFHALALLGTALAIELFPALAARLRWVAGLLLAGIVLFSGSLYLLATTDAGTLGWITPLGGVTWIVGWGWMAWIFWTARRRPGN